MAPSNGLFIALEGGEGAGKTTLLEGLSQRLQRAGLDVVAVREPGGTRFGERAREILATEDLSPWAEALTFLAARAELVERVLRPVLSQGGAVICDRFAASTFAYQGYGRGLDITALKLANRIATGDLAPDLTVLLDIDPNVGLARKEGEQGAVRTGNEGLEFHRRVREGFLELSLAAPAGTWVKIDASLPAAEVIEKVWGVVSPRLHRLVKHQPGEA
ncbi:MAG: dTMP kinase [Dehalococcoidia bacterium]